MNSKILDFGMARIFGSNDSKVNTNGVVGTKWVIKPLCDKVHGYECAYMNVFLPSHTNKVCSIVQWLYASGVCDGGRFLNKIRYL